MQHGAFKSSTILISSGKKTRIYRSPTELPADMRQKLEEITSGDGAFQVVIADRAGRRAIQEAIRSEQNPQPGGNLGSAARRKRQLVLFVFWLLLALIAYALAVLR